MLRFLRPVISMVVLSAVATMSMSVQASEGETTHKPEFGVRAKFDMSTSRTVKEISAWGPGGMAGISGYFPFGKMTYFNPALYFGCLTVKLDGTAGTEKTPVYFDGHMSIIGAQLPLDLGVNLVQNQKFRFSVFTGPHFGINFAVKGDYKMIDPKTGAVFFHHKKNLDEFNGFEAAWGVGVAADFNRHWHFQVGADIGLTTFAKMNKVYPEGMADFKRLGISVGLGYNF